MSTQTQVFRVLWYEGFGFLLIIVLSWINELTEFSQFFGGTEYIPNWRESVLETLIVLLVAFPVMIITKRIVSRLYYLEGFVHLCAWCKKLEHNDEWLPLEEFFERQFQTQTSHGMCVACSEAMKAKMKKLHAA